MRDNSKIKSFNFKWYEFLIIYGIINLFIFYCCLNSCTDGVFSESIGDNLHEDMEGVSTFLEVFIAAPFVGIFYVIGIAIFLMLEFVSMLIFRLVYFRSLVKDAEMLRLSQYIKNTILCFLFAYFLCIILFGGISQIVNYGLIYLPIPLFAFIFIYLKVKNSNKEVIARKANWSKVLVYLFIIIGIYFCVNFVLMLRSFFVL